MLKITEKTPFPATYENPYDPITNEGDWEEPEPEPYHCDWCGEDIEADEYVYVPEEGRLCPKCYAGWMIVRDPNPFRVGRKLADKFDISFQEAMDIAWDEYHNDQEDTVKLIRRDIKNLEKIIRSNHEKE